MSTRAADPSAFTLPVREVFGPVWQGEGPYLGRRCHFVRLGHCNLHCPGCDTADTWDHTRFDLEQTCPPATVFEIMNRLWDCGPARMVVLSGGEPLMHQRKPAFGKLLECLSGVQVHVETNGTITPTPEAAAAVAHFTVSPKLSAMGGADPTRRRIRTGVLAAFTDLAHAGRASFKIVCASGADVEEAARFVSAHDIPPEHVWIMPYTDAGATDRAGRPAALADVHAAIGAATRDAGFNLTTRLHVLADYR